MAKAVDISTSRRIGVLTALMEKMGGLSEPQQAIELFEQGMREAYEALGTVHLSTLELGAGEYRISRLAGGNGVEHVSSRPPWDYRTLPVQSGGILSDLVEAGRPCILHDLDLSSD